MKARDGRKAASDLYRPVIGSYSADYPLQVVQMDHTPADIIIVDGAFPPASRSPHSHAADRCGVARDPRFYVCSRAPRRRRLAWPFVMLSWTRLPGWRSVRLRSTIRSSAFPKRSTLITLREFNSRALERGCQQYGIELKYRPIATPHYGGHIERLIGTTIGEVHLLPGTTFSNIRAKGDYDAEGLACMTLKDFERWFALQVGIYHGLVHGELGVPPLTAWSDGITARPTPLRLPADQDRFLLDFLPFEMRRIRREGIELFHAFYWHGALASLAANGDRKLPIKYNPLNLSAVYVELPSGKHLSVPLRDRRRPPITRFEHDLAVKALRERGRLAVDEQSLFDMVREQRRIVADAIDKTKAARRSAQRIAYAWRAGLPALATLTPPALVDATASSDTEPIVALPDRGAGPMTDLYDHLFPAYREQAGMPDDERIDWLRRDRWYAFRRLKRLSAGSRMC